MLLVLKIKFGKTWNLENDSECRRKQDSVVLTFSNKKIDLGLFLYIDSLCFLENTNTVFSYSHEPVLELFAFWTPPH